MGPQPQGVQVCGPLPQLLFGAAPGWQQACRQPYQPGSLCAVGAQCVEVGAL